MKKLPLLLLAVSNPIFFLLALLLPVLPLLARLGSPGSSNIPPLFLHNHTIVKKFGKF